MEQPDGQAGSLLVISPHLDDAVLGCGELLAATPGAVVLSIFSGAGKDPTISTNWDTACGFESAQQALSARLMEDDAALGLLDARPLRLNFPDDQYRGESETVDLEALADAIHSVLQRYKPQVVAIPLGLFHRDHALAHEAALRLFAKYSAECAWLAYEDAFYRRIPGLLQQRLCSLASAGCVATPLGTPRKASTTIKRLAVQCYASQLRGLGSPGRPGHLDALAPEGYWRLAPVTQPEVAR